MRRGSFHRLHADREVIAFGRWLDQEKIVVVLNASSVTKVIDIPVKAIGLTEGALAAVFNIDQRWSIVDGILREVKLPPRSALVLI